MEPFRLPELVEWSYVCLFGKQASHEGPRWRAAFLEVLKANHSMPALVASGAAMGCFSYMYIQTCSELPLLSSLVWGLQELRYSFKMHTWLVIARGYELLGDARTRDGVRKSKAKKKKVCKRLGKPKGYGLGS